MGSITTATERGFNDSKDWLDLESEKFTGTMQAQTHLLCVDIDA